MTKPSYTDADLERAKRLCGEHRGGRWPSSADVATEFADIRNETIERCARAFEGDDAVQGDILPRDAAEIIRELKDTP
ncbi:MAG TPA: hypothetical protein VGO53_16325 [Steroidobacteraceae bacterium]|nr:hypothetical protein [Steroidobacteraceae bacterium]